MNVLTARNVSLIGMAVCLGIFSDLSAKEAGEINESRGVIELLVSPNDSEKEEGERQWKARRTNLIDGFLERIKEGDLEDKRRAAYQLGLALSPWMRGREAGERSYGESNFPAPARPVGRNPNIPEGKVIRSVLQQTIENILTQETSEARKEFLRKKALEALRETLVEVANDSTIDWAVDFLSRTKSSAQTEFMIELANSCLGVPPEYRMFGVCGNSSAAEIENYERFERSEAARARATLAKSWSRVRTMGPKDRTAFVLAKWKEHFARLEKEDPENDNSLNEWFFLQMEPLVRLGSDIVPELRVGQAREETLKRKAMWEVPIATITGQEKDDLVHQLLGGDRIEAAMACEILVAAGSKRWLKELDQLQKRRDFSRMRASDAIASCFRSEGIPALKRGLAADRKNYVAEYSLKELKLWAKRGFPAEMGRYEYRKTGD